MAKRTIEHCENCGAYLGRPVEKLYGDFIVCGERECSRAEQDFHAQQREEAHEQLDRDLGYF